MPHRVFITAAEVSGDKHAAQLIRSLRQLQPDLLIEGLGGPEMAAAGARIHRDTVTRAAMGWRGALRAAEIYRVLRWTRRHFAENRPGLWIGVDSPSMNFHFARAAKEMGIPTLQYVAPQLWAWAPRRMKKLRKWVDHVACILPFEESYFRSHGVNATFVGHPLFDELPADRGPGPQDKFPNRPPIVGLLPGSRRSEAQANFPGLLEVAERIRQQFPQVTFLVPTTAATHPEVERLVTGLDWERAHNGARDSFRILDGRHLSPAMDLGKTSESGMAGSAADPSPGRVDSAATLAANNTPPRSLIYQRDSFDVMVPRCDLCLTVSGTATLHVAAFGIPMVVVYRASRAIWHLLGRWIIPTRTFALVNVLSSRDGKSPAVNEAAATSRPEHIVPEFVPWFGESLPVAESALQWLRHPEKLADQAIRLRRLIQTLDRPGASLEVARIALGMLK